MHWRSSGDLTYNAGKWSRALIRARSLPRDPLPERGGRPRRYYTVTPAGLASVRAARAAIDNLSRGVSLGPAR